MARRSDHSREEIREMALAAAEKIIAEEGFSSLSTRRLAAAIGYTVGTLYLVFRNLDDLVVQINERTLDELYRSLKKSLSRCQEPEACIPALGHAYIQFATENTHRWNLVFEYGIPKDDETLQKPQARVSQIFELVETSLQPLAKGQSKKQIAQAARALWGGVHGICVLSLSNSLDIAGVQSVNVLTDSLIKNYLLGFTAS